MEEEKDHKNENYLDERNSPIYESKEKSKIVSLNSDFGHDDNGEKDDEKKMANKKKHAKTSRESKTGLIDGKKRSTKASRKKMDLAIPLILASLTVVIIGIASFYLLLSKKERPEPQQKETAQQIIKSSMLAMRDIKTYYYDAKIETNFENRENSESFEFKLDLVGRADQSDINNVKSFNNIKAVMNTSAENGDQGMSFDLDGAQFGQNKIYFKLNEYDFREDAGTMIGQELSFFKGKWYKIDIEEMASMNLIPFDGNGVGMETYDMNKIIELYGKYELLKFQEDLGETKINNAEVYHYRAKLDGVALANFYIDVLKEMMAKGDLNQTFNFEQIKEDVEKYSYIIKEITDKIDMEVWIGKEDKFMYKMKIAGNFDEKFIEVIGNKMVEKGDLSEEEFAQDQEMTDSFEISFNIDINMKDFNKLVEINEPAEAKNFMDILKMFMGGFLGTVASMNIDTDEDGLFDRLEVIYGTDINNPDTDGDGYKDGEEVENGYDPLIAGSARLDYDKLYDKLYE